MEESIMAYYKVIFSIEKIVECDNYQEAEMIARDDINRSDYFDSHAYELKEEEVNKAHNVGFDILSK